MEYKVENFQPSPSFTAPTLVKDCTAKPSYKLSKSTGQMDLLKNDRKPQHDKVSLDLSPNGSQLNITINGTTLKVTKNSCDISIGNFSIKLNSHCNKTPNPSNNIIVEQPSAVAIVSLSLGTPLHVISTGDTPCVTAALSLSKLTIKFMIYY